MLDILAIALKPYLMYYHITVTVHDCLMISIQTISWLVAALVIVINGYLLLEFFSSEVSGAVVTAIVSAITAAYVAFIVYLISSAFAFTPWQSFTRSKTVASTES
jgi:natural resistance-associated macrophage protein